MKDIGLHLVLLFLAGTAIVVVTTLFAEPDDQEALRAFPRRWLKFFVTTAIVVAVMLLIEHTVATVQ